jgi:RHS repeat-associated protein
LFGRLLRSTRHRLRKVKLTYDAENRLTTATRATPAKSASYRYDGIDRRYTKTVDGVRTDYLWSGQNIVAEYAVPNPATPGSQSLQRRYVHGPGIDEPIAMLQYNGANTPVLTDIQYYHADHAGTVVAMSGGLTGQPNFGKLRDSYKYSVYGESDPSTSGNIFRYTGRQLDPETGLYYYRARMYNPALGRFLQTDPAGDVDSLNLYQYALWDPIMNKDPSGRCGEENPARACRQLGDSHGRG